MTSPIPCGTVSACAASTPVSTRVCGKAKLAATATKAARKVVSIYRNSTLPNLLSSLPDPCARAPLTRTKTRTGAIAFSAPTKRFPRISSQLQPGSRKARAIPMMIPHKIRRIRLVSLYFFAALFRKFKKSIPCSSSFQGAGTSAASPVY